MEILLISASFIISGIALLVLSYSLYIKSINSKNWVKTKGVVLKANLDELVMEADTPVTYKVNIEYSYVVGESTYYSKRRFYGDFLRHSSFGDIGKHMNKYQKGNIVDVYYNPQKPNEAVLEQGLHLNLVIIAITSFLLMSIGVILVLVH